jgi:hypothetical protein
MENEIWKQFAVGYEVSSFGNVRSIDRVVKTAKQPLNLKGKMLKPAIDKKGYKRVAIMVDGKLTTLKVHRIVAKAFIDNVDDKPQVNHIDCIKTNNEVRNLEWVNNSENIQHAFDNGLMKAKRLHESPRCKQTKEGIEEIVRLKAQKVKNKIIAEMFNCSITSIKRLNRDYAIYSN